MRPDHKSYSAPRLRKIDTESVFKQGWNREQMFQVRELTAQAIELLETNGSQPDVVSELRAAIERIDSGLAKTGNDSA